jgi:glycosyltransferase involved in cell wall biosynthesis
MSPPQRQPKLLYLVTEDWYFVSHRLALATAARNMGFEVAVATRRGKQAEAIKDAGLRLLPIKLSRSGVSPLREVRSVSELIRLYRREKPDIVHHIALKPVVYGSIAARLAGVQHVVNALMGLGYVFASDRPKARMLRPLVEYLLRGALHHRSSRTIVQNRQDEELLKQRGLAPESTIRLIRGSGVDPADYASAPPPTGQPLVILPARLLRDKGVMEFAEAARTLKAEGAKARFAFVGAPDPGNPASVTKQEIDALVRAGSIEYWGWRDNMPSVLAQASIVCLPSYYGEGLPKALLEAAASARAIVATDVPGCRDVVKQGVNGWLVPPRDPVALAHALRKAINDPELCARYGVAGRALVEREFSLEQVIGETLAIYSDLLKES